MARSKTKKIFHFLHLWIGLITGAVVFIVSITGSIYVFKDELYIWAHHDIIYNNTTEKQATLPPKTLHKVAENYLGDSIVINNITAFNEPNRNWECEIKKYNKNASSFFDELEYKYTIYVNPYTGKLAGVVNHQNSFFRYVLGLHLSLWLEYKIGHLIVGISVLLFVVSLITGLIIWFPKRIKQFKQSITIKWKSRWRRVNYDIHRSLGFFVFPFALIIAITGLVWAFDFVEKFVYTAATLSTTEPEHPTFQSELLPSEQQISETELWSNALQNAINTYPTAYLYGIYAPNNADTFATLDIWTQPNKFYWHNSILQQYDRYSGQLLHTETPEDKNNGELLHSMNYDLHVGQILGIWGKILAFIASLLCASLPVTGFLIWWGRRKKEKQKRTQHLSATQKQNL